MCWGVGEVRGDVRGSAGEIRREVWGCEERCGDVCWGCGRDEWSLVGDVEKCVGYMTINDNLLQGRDDLMRGRFHAKRVKWNRGWQLGKRWKLVSRFGTPPPRP